jgi:hypothetical protein
VSRVEAFRHEFVEHAPDRLEPGVLYVSLPYKTVMHLCPCGCGHEVVTPLSPTGWALIFDGATLSLYPSVGNWSFPCQSHYWIDHGRVRWSWKWSKDRIERARASRGLRLIDESEEPAGTDRGQQNRARDRHGWNA